MPGCLLNMVFLVVLYVTWCGRLEGMAGITPQLYADNLKCSAVCFNALFLVLLGLLLGRLS